MRLSFEILGKRHLQWLMDLRNQNRTWFMNSEEIKKYPHYNWFIESCERGDLNLVIVDPDTFDRIGFISIYNMSGGCANIGRMMVDDRFKHQGYMKRAMIKVFLICKTMFNLEQLTLEVKSDNIIASDLYVTMGFMTIGFTEKSYLMRKIL